MLVFLSACHKAPDEERIQDILHEMITAIESGQPAGIGEYLHEDFRANRNLDAAQIRQMLLLQGMQHARISITVVSSQTILDPVYTDKATTQLSLIVTGLSGRGFPEDGGVHTASLEWRRDSDWKLLKADWR